MSSFPGLTDEQEGSPIEIHSPPIQLNPYLHQCFPDKALADTTEALVGAYLLTFGSEGAWSFLEWLGMKLIKQDEVQDTLGENTSLVEKESLLTSLASTSGENTLNPQPVDQVFDDAISRPRKPPHPLLSANALFPSHRSSSADETVEAALNYKFNNYSLLQQAFTHTSLPRDYNSVRCSYEQLEFLGDALLDFLVTHHLYIHHSHMSPGDLTDLRSAVVNNYSFAALAVKLGFAKHLQSLSPPLLSIVNNFIVKLKEKEMKQQQVNHDEVTR